MLTTIVVGIIVGYLASLIVKGEGLGLIGDLVVGVLGSWLGRYLAGSLGIQATNTLGNLLISILGAVVLLVILRALFGGKTKNR